MDVPTPTPLSNQQARRVFLYLHGLASAPQKKLTTADVLALIEHIGFVQVDSINTVERAHHMIVFARNQMYRQEQLAHLLEHERSLFENWTHDASIIPSRFYRYWQPRFAREKERLRLVWQQRRRQGFEAQLEQVLEHIQAQGPVMARDLGTEQKKQAQGWWDWHPSKTALEYLWRSGDLAIMRRQGFQKVYDLAERVIPQVHRDGTVSREEEIDWACQSALQRLGFATPRDLAGFWQAISAAEAQAWCKRHLGSAVCEVMVENANGAPPRRMFARADLMTLVQDVPPPPRRLRFLSPFDPLIRDRLRTHRLFNFDYRIEVFVPAPQRRYGYYVFPILEGDRLIGRMDMKHWRQKGQVIVTGLWLEPGQRFGRTRQRELEAALERLRRFTRAVTVHYENGYVQS